MALLLHPDLVLLVEKELKDLKSKVPVRLCFKQVDFHLTDSTHIEPRHTLLQRETTLEEENAWVDEVPVRLMFKPQLRLY